MVAADMWERSTTVDKALQRVTYLYVKHFISALKKGTMYEAQQMGEIRQV